MSRLGLLMIDPYNDFLSFPGKSWLLTRRTPDFSKRVDNMRRVLKRSRQEGVPVFYAPHARHRGETYNGRQFFNPSIYQADFFRAFRAGSWGGRFRKELQPEDDDMIAEEHQTSSGFVNTNLADLLNGKEIDEVVVCGALSNTCIESSVRSAIDLGFQVTVLTDAIVAMSKADHEAAMTSFEQICHRTARTGKFLQTLNQ